MEGDLARIIHDGSSAPSPSLPHTMGEGEGGGPFLVKRISRRPSFVKRISQAGKSMLANEEIRDTRYEIRATS